MCLGQSWRRSLPGFPSCSWQVIAITPRKMPCNPSSRSCSERDSIRSSFSRHRCTATSFCGSSPRSPRRCFQFLETTLKNRPVEWEPQYNLTPVTFGDAQIVMNAKPSDVRKDQSKPKDQPKIAAPPAPNAKADEAKKQKGRRKERKQPAAKEGVPCLRNRHKPETTAQLQMRFFRLALSRTAKPA